MTTTTTTTKKMATFTTMAILAAGCAMESRGGSNGTEEEADTPDDDVRGGGDGYDNPVLDPWAPLPDEAEARDWALMRRAIDLGHGVGQEVYVTSINVELARANLEARYEGAAPFVVAGAVQEAPAAEAGTCPYVESIANDGSSSVSCRYLTERARDEAYIRTIETLADRPLAGDFALATDPASIQDWYEYSSDFGVDGEFVRAMDDLREQGACDTAPTALESSYEAGVALGRALMTSVTEEVVARTAATVCDIDNGIVAPAVADALGRVDASVEAAPLCAGIDLDSIDDVSRFRQAELEYEGGVADGIREQSVVESEQLFRTWICTPPFQGGGGGGGGGGDPLVLDLDGDGIRIEQSGPLFAYGVSGPVRTAWTEPGDAFVVLDRDGDGRIVSSELFGDVTVTEDGMSARDGFEAIALYDAESRGGNGDGTISAADDVHGALGVWTDVDGDAQVDAGELVSLADAGVVSIDPSAGNFERADGRTGLAADLTFSYVAAE